MDIRTATTLRRKIAIIVAREAGWASPNTDHLDAAVKIIGLVGEAQNGDATREASGPMCRSCKGYGELVTDWERYVLNDDDDAVEECPDCNGTGHVVDEAQSKAAGK